MSIEHFSSPEKNSEYKNSQSFPRIEFLRGSITLAVFLSLAGCASDAQHTSMPTNRTYSVSPDVSLPVTDPSLITLEEIAAISSGQLTSERIQEFQDQMEIADGNLRMHRIFIARESARSPQNSQVLRHLLEEKSTLEAAAQRLVSSYLEEAGIRFSFDQLRYPAAFRLQELFDQEAELQERPGDLNTYLIHQLRQEEIKLRHLRIMHHMCRTDRQLSSEEQAENIQQIAAKIRATEDVLQLLQNTFHRRMR